VTNTEKGLRDFWSRSQTLELTASGIAAKGKGFLLGFDSFPSADHGTVNLRDGVTVAGSVIALNESSGRQGCTVGFPIPRPFNVGLYVDFADRMDRVVVHYVLDRGIAAE
jgi:hypothetical protein